MRNTIVIFFATKSEPWPAFCTIIFIIYLFRLTCELFFCFYYIDDIISKFLALADKIHIEDT